MVVLLRATGCELYHNDANSVSRTTTKTNTNATTRIGGGDDDVCEGGACECGAQE
jgi:hypothetical protein